MFRPAKPADSYVAPQATAKLGRSSRPGTKEGTPSLTQCQISTPPQLVAEVWRLILQRRRVFAEVLDLGAGDGRFAIGGTFKSYRGIDIEPSRPHPRLPRNAVLVQQCALAELGAYDLVIGNPPYVRIQDIDASWRASAASLIQNHTGRRPDGRSNAYLYFMWIALARSKSDGVVAVVVPSDWLIREAATTYRQYLKDQKLNVAVYSLNNTRDLFPTVRTTASIVIIDKDSERFSLTTYAGDFRAGWKAQRQIRQLPRAKRTVGIRAQRGLSPGSRAVFCLTEAERTDAGIQVSECVACATTLKHLPTTCSELSARIFKQYYVDTGVRCWLLKTDAGVSPPVSKWLSKAPRSIRENTTCSERRLWYQYTLPAVPGIIYSSGFSGTRPRFLLNTVNAIHVGTVHGIIGIPSTSTVATDLLEYLKSQRVHRLVPRFSEGMSRIDVSQMDSLIAEYRARIP
jgi:Eco57I restriction-modification methylase